jgi:hypothetical protein
LSNPTDRAQIRLAGAVYAELKNDKEKKGDEIFDK